MALPFLCATTWRLVPNGVHQGVLAALCFFISSAHFAPARAQIPAAPAAKNGADEPLLNSSSGGDNLQGQRPRVEFTKLRHDFGDILRGSRVSHSFDFVNAGSGVLQIRSIHASCGCAKTQVEPKDQFAPGEKGRITFEFDSSYFAGPLVRTLTVDTNAPMPSTVTLTFTAEILEELQVRPALLSVGEVPRDFSKEFLLNLNVVKPAPQSSLSPTLPVHFERVSLPDDVKKALLKSDGEVRPVHVTSSVSGLSASIVQEPGKEPKIKIKFQGNLPIGPFRERVTVWNTSRHLKELVIPVIGEVVGHVRPSAKYLEFGVVRRPKTVRRTLTLNSDLKDFRVESVEVDLRRSESLREIKTSDIIKYTTEKSGQGVVVHFDLRFPDSLPSSAGDKPLNTSGVFVVRTSDPDYKEIRVPFFGVLKQDMRN